MDASINGLMTGPYCDFLYYFTYCQPVEDYAAKLDIASLLMFVK